MFLSLALRLDNTLEEIIFKLVPGLRESESSYLMFSLVCLPFVGDNGTL